MKKLCIAIMLSFCIPTLSYTESFLSHAYSSILGNEDVSPDFREILETILQEMGVTHTKDILIKRINKKRPFFSKLSSFTAHGIWIDEEYLNTCSYEEMTMHLYHEAAHYAKKHHQKQFLWGAGLCAGVIGSIVGIHKTFNSSSVDTITTLLALAVAGKGITCVVKSHEKEADLHAATAILVNKKDGRQLLESYVSILEASACYDTPLIWWPTIVQQISYLKALLTITA